jgi:hypothetical protein
VEARYAPVRAFKTNYNLESMAVEIELGSARGAQKLIIGFHYLARLSHVKGPDDCYFEQTMFSLYSWFPYLIDESGPDKWSCTPFTYAARLLLPEDWDMARVGTSFTREGRAIEAASSATVASFSLAFLKGHNVYTRGWLSDKKELDVYYRPDSEEAARLAGSFAKEGLEYCSERYFPLETSFVSGMLARYIGRDPLRRALGEYARQYRYRESAQASPNNSRRTWIWGQAAARFTRRSPFRWAARTARSTSRVSRADLWKPARH